MDRQLKEFLINRHVAELMKAISHCVNELRDCHEEENFQANERRYWREIANVARGIATSEEARGDLAALQDSRKKDTET